jgi:para-nitrobenzyl esterase
MTTPAVETTYGSIAGTRQSGVAVFRGIPYAGSVAGRNRWRPAPPPSPWAGIREATEFSPVIPQSMGAFNLPIEMPSYPESEEDALTVNVWTPAADGAKRAVMVWISCGGFSQSTGGDPMTNGARLAADHDVVVVTFNCRPGLLGIMYLGDILGPDYEMGNMALVDQVTALKWVHDNIANFGGDPANVTIFGCSGSGFSVAALLTMPMARGLIRRAIPQSGVDYSAVQRHHATELATFVLRALGIEKTPEKIFDLPAQQILEVHGKFRGNWREGWGWTRAAMAPVVDGVSMPMQPLDAAAAGAGVGTDVMVGCLRRDMEVPIPEELMTPELEAALVWDIKTTEELADVMAAACDALNVNLSGTRRADLMASGYVALQNGNVNEALGIMKLDVLMRMATIRLAQGQIANGWPAARVYYFDYAPATHGMEIPFIFGTVNESWAGSYSSIQGADKLQERMSAVWSSFAKTGEPAHSDIPEWPRYSLEKRETMIIDETWRVENDFYGAERKLWDGVQVGNRTALPGQVFGRP